MSFFHKTKIVATLGPAITQKLFTMADFEDPKNLEKKKAAYQNMEKAINAGLYVARLNFSHGTQEEHLIRLNILRETADKLNRNVYSLLDTKGPEIRVCKMASDEGALIKSGDKITIDSLNKPLGNSSILGVTDSTGFYNMAKDLKVGRQVLLDDGKLVLEVTDLNVEKGIIHAIAKNTHTIKTNKRINLPGSKYTMEFFSTKDKDDIRFAIKNEFDYVALSFVNSAENVNEVRQYAARNGSKKIKLISKIETMTAIENLDEIIEASDGIMIARGDLGIEIPYSLVPHWEKEMIRRCREANKPVIVATQMLDSLERGPLPTRAEVTDVFFAVENGTDATMLSGETAQGAYPIEALKVMSNIIRKSEQTFDYESAANHEYVNSKISRTKDGKACLKMVNEMFRTRIIKNVNVEDTLQVLILFTNNANMIKSFSSLRTYRIILAFTDSEAIYRDFGLEYGVFTQLLPSLEISDKRRKEIIKECKEMMPKNSDFSAIYRDSTNNISSN